MELQNGLYIGIAYNGQPICRSTSCSATEAEKKKYWHYTCHACGFADNRNNNPDTIEMKIVDGKEIYFIASGCKKCGVMIRCETAGGHTHHAGDYHCTGGCGLMRDGSYDSRYRRDNY